MKVLTFGASNSKNSINKQLAFYAAQQINNADVSLIDINDFEMPIYSEDREKESGIPKLAHDFYNAIGAADSIVMSFAEYNGSYTSAYKNLFDWTSRINMKVFQSKPVIMLSTSPGPSGAQSVLAAAQASAPYFSANLIGAISLPNFYDNFDAEKGIVTNETFNQHLLSCIDKLSIR
ncbi:NADPH-dependent FMN reductase [Marinomonas sp. FW-1]|uniref:NADPH-dependent FMN reductase n=1 Tax=Marinomonas sp. FW-1 TaxID=2071621 RepID=UPI0010BFB56B|nr:NAD(P)H-dependent oxidoreductase [Marinomonas sp. FW-1]